MKPQPRRAASKSWWRTTLGLVCWYGFGYSMVVAITALVVWIVAVTR